MGKRTYTTNGCYYTEPSVNPKNWKSGGSKLIAKDWQIQFYFFDPKFSNKKPYGKLVSSRGMNHCKNLRERRSITNHIITTIIQELESGYNHFTGQFMTDQSIKHGILHPELPFIKAFRIAHTKLKCSKRYLESVSYGIDHIEQAALKLKISRTTISDISRRDVKQLLDICKLTNDSYNRHRTFMSSLFNELVEYECCEYNLTRDIQSKQTVKKVRKTLDPEQLKEVLNHIKSKDYNFYRFIMIFMMSGSRISELLRIKDEIDLQNQEYKVIIKKGRLNQEVIKVIINESLQYWRELYQIKEVGDYLFSYNLIPGLKPYRRAYISKKWLKLVKKDLGYDADLYSLKHSFLDSLEPETARMMAHHLSSKTTDIYRVNQAKRDREELKKIKVSIL